MHHPTGERRPFPYDEAPNAGAQFDDLADAPIPLHLVAFDLAEGREVLVSRGPALESVIATASIPGVFPPVRIGELRLVDGGVVNNTPISHAVELGAERIYVLPTGELSNRRLDSTPNTRSISCTASSHGWPSASRRRF